MNDNRINVSSAVGFERQQSKEMQLEFKKLEKILREVDEKVYKKLEDMRVKLKNERKEEVEGNVDVNQKYCDTLLKIYREARDLFEKSEKCCTSCITKLDNNIKTRTSMKKRKVEEDVTSQAKKNKKLATKVEPVAKSKSYVARANSAGISSASNVSSSSSSSSASFPVNSFHEPILPVGTTVAAKISKPKHKPDWILASIVNYIPESGKYEVEDEDPGDEFDPNPSREHYQLPRKCLIPLPLQVGAEYEFARGSQVLAMYPETTTFYSATVVATPSERKKKDYQLNFVEDTDEIGEPIKREVSPAYVVAEPKS
eukprot:TRINITY_DN8084_c0_g1_i1.p1 TRINITY_DN8084_c0_g1~~TRINITY_DN8084_c0_g1_i1.p1  ORF type:complete len:314 (+),score=74.15 TRINITY_DN8084_c0_g1_i1:94-1035(+)